MYLRVAAVGFVFLLTTNQTVRAQYISSTTDDKTYFDNLQYDIEGEVEEARENLVDQAKVVEVATRNFAASKLKQNFFKALRYLAERELEAISMQDRIRQPRQDVGGDDSDSANTKRTVPRIPVVANILKVAFGNENATVNFTSHLQSASKLIFRPIGSQITGLTNLLGYTQPIPQKQIGAASVGGQPSYNNISNSASDNQVARVLKKNSESLNSTRPVDPATENSGILLNENDNSNVTIVEFPTQAVGGIENGTGPRSPPDSTGPGVIYIDVLAKDIQEGLDGLLKAMPDLFKGAKEAITLLESIRDIYDY